MVSKLKVVLLVYTFDSTKTVEDKNVTEKTLDNQNLAENMRQFY